jgi:hypothetical protein
LRDRAGHRVAIHPLRQPAGMPSEDPIVGTTVDPHGREVVLPVRIWQEKISRDHPELAGHLAAVFDAVSQPDHVEPDSLPDRSRFYRRNVGPNRWLLAVVSYEQEPARIITALANRKDPKQWKP